MVDAPHQQKVHQILHKHGVLTVAERAEHLAHRATLHVGCEMRQRRRQLGENIVEKATVTYPRRASAGVDIVLHSGHDLVKHNINSAHVLPFQRSHVMAHTAAHVAVFVLNNMADIHHAVCMAPIGQLLGKALAVQPRDGFHIGKADLGLPVAVLVILVPEQVQMGRGVKAERLGHHPEHRVVPRQRQGRLSDAGLVKAKVKALLAAHQITKTRLIRKETCEGVPEVLLEMLVMALINRFDQHVHRVGVDHINVFLQTATSGTVIEENSPYALGDIPRQIGAVDLIREVDRLVRATLLVIGVSFVGVGANEDVLLVVRINDDRSRGGRSYDVYMALVEQPLPLFRILFGNPPRGVPRGKLIVVQKPDLHAQLFCLLQNKSEITPPALTAKVRVRTGLHAHSAASAAVDSLHLVGNQVRMVSSLPVERENVIFLSPVQNIANFSIHSILHSAALRQTHNRCRQPTRLFCKDPNTKGRLHPYRIAFLFVKITASRNFVVLLYHTSGCFSIFFLKCFVETSGLPQGRGLLLPPVILYRLPRRYQCTAPQQQNSERFCIRNFKVRWQKRCPRFIGILLPPLS